MVKDPVLSAWADATDLVDTLVDNERPGSVVTFEWPGTINVEVAPDRMLIFGTVNETINGNELVLNGDMWDEGDNSTDTLALLDTDLSSESTDSAAIASAIVAAVRRWLEAHGSN